MLQTEPSDAIIACWQMGIVGEWYLRDDQQPLYDLLESSKRPFLECSRRYGKSTSLFVWVDEKLRANKGWVARWIFPEKDQGREILSELFEALYDTCPLELRPRYSRDGSVYIFPNGSKLYVHGVDKDRGRRMRGRLAHIILLDEFAFWTHPHIVKSVLAPQLLTTRGWMVTVSTPAENLGHPYYVERERAKRANRFLRRIIFDNASLTQEDITQAMEDAGGADSPEWKREYLCEDVVDPTMLVTPEWGDKHPEDQAGPYILPDDHARPAHFIPFVAGDSGFDDNTALLFGYYDFKNDIDVVEFEYVISGQTTKKIVENAKRIEEALWGGLFNKNGKPLKPSDRVYDADKQSIFNICNTYRYEVFCPDKDRKRVAIHSLRSRIGDGRFFVKQRCAHLLRQLRVGTWRDEKRKDFDRSDELGHLDALSAAIYFNRHLDRRTNPWPQAGVNPEFVFAPGASSPGTTEDQLKKIFEFAGGE